MIAKTLPNVTDGNPALIHALQPDAAPSMVNMTAQMPELPAAPMARVITPPSPQQQNLDAAEGKLQKIRFQEANPWGTANNHPGTAGKIAHVLSVAGNIAGDIFAPGIMARVPGTDLNRQVQENGLENQIDSETGEISNNAARDANTNLLEHPRPHYEEVATDKGIESYDPSTGTFSAPGGANGPVMPYTKPGPRQHVFLQGADGKPLAATFDPQSGTYYDAHDTPIQNPQPYEKPAAPNELSMWLKEHPGKTVDDYIGMQNAMKPEFPRIVPVNDAKGNIVGYNTFSGTGGGVRTEFVPLSTIHGLPQNLGGTPGVIPPKPTGTVLTQSQRAEMIQPQVAALTGQIDKTASQLGPLAGRWSDVMAGRVGADNPDVAKLQMQLKMFTTALMLAHGLRGEEYERSLSQYLNTAQSPANLIARIQGADAYLQDYAGATGHGSNPNTPQHGGENGGNGGGMIRAVDPQGKLHEAPAGTPLPKGWKLQ